MDDKLQADNQVPTHQYLSPNYFNSVLPNSDSSIRMGWPTYEEAKEAWKNYYNNCLEIGVDRKELNDVTIVKITINEEKIEEL